MDFIGNGVIAWAPAELIEGAFYRSTNVDSLSRAAQLARRVRAESAN